MGVDDRVQKQLTEMLEARETIRDLQNRLSDGGGGPTSGPMDQRVTRLETHMEYVRRDLDEIRAGQSSLLAAVHDLKSDLTSIKSGAAGKVTVISTGIAIVAIIVGVLAFGGDRFSQGMEVAAAADAARSAPNPPPWANDPIVPPTSPTK